MNQGYVTWSKLNINSAIHRTEENNVLPLQTTKGNDKEEALAGAAAALSLLSSPTNSSASENLSQSSVKMKCYYHHKHHCFLDYFTDPILDDAVIYASDKPFQYNEREGRYTECIGNPTGTVFVAAKRDHNFLLSQRSNTPNMSSNSVNFGH